jgi:hypothetical protein
LTEVNDKIPATNMRKQGIILSVLGIGAATVADKLLDVMYFYYSR